MVCVCVCAARVCTKWTEVLPSGDASWDQRVSTVQYCFTSTETIRLVRTDSPGQPPRLSHNSWTMNNVGIILYPHISSFRTSTRTHASSNHLSRQRTDGTKSRREVRAGGKGGITLRVLGGSWSAPGGGCHPASASAMKNDPCSPTRPVPLNLFTPHAPTVCVTWKTRCLWNKMTTNLW